jgi:hypothetical protein
MSIDLPPQPPFSGNVLFYTRPEPLSREAHRRIGLRRVTNPFAFARASNVAPLTVAEFPLAGLTYPIIFAGERRMPLAVMGLGQGQNLFVNQDGAFETGAYIPAYIRRYPFVFAANESRDQMVLCIDRDATMLGEDYDLPFFNEKGEPSDYLQGCIKFCNDFESEGRRTESFVKLLTDLDLFEIKRSNWTPMNPDGTQGPPQTVAEFFGVSEEKVKALPSEKLLELVANGALSQIFAHLMSLNGWERLMTMSMARQPVPGAANIN